MTLTQPCLYAPKAVNFKVENVIHYCVHKLQNHENRSQSSQILWNTLGNCAQGLSHNMALHIPIFQQGAESKQYI